MPTATTTQGLHSFIWDSEDYYLESRTFVPTAIVGSNKKSFVFINTNISLIPANMTLCSIWESSAGNRSFILRVTSTGKVEYVQSSDGTTTDITTATDNALGSSWQSIIVTVDPTEATLANVVKVYFDGTAQTMTSSVNTGTFTTNTASTMKLTLGCFFTAGKVPNSYYKGYINQFIVTSDIISQAEVTSFYNSGLYQIANTFFDNVVIGANFDQADFTGTYLVYDLINSNHFYQVNANTAAGRKSHWCLNLNPKGIDGGSFTDDFADDKNFFTFFGALGTSSTFNTPGFQININHTSTLDQDRNSHEMLSKSAFDLNIADVYVGYTYNYAAAGSLPHSHGGASVIDCRNDNTDAVWTHRSLVNSNETYRILIDDDLAVQVDNETTIPKGNQVWTKFSKNGSNCDVTFYWNNGNVLTQVWTTQQLLGVRHLRLKFHARDYNLYNNPNNYTITNLRVTRSTPTLP